MVCPQQRYAQRLRKKALAKLGNRCANPTCAWVNDDGTRGCTDARCLQIDHVNGGGNKERKSGIYGGRLSMDVLRDVEHKYQLLCANCNWIKKFEKGELSVKPGSLGWNAEQRAPSGGSVACGHALQRASRGECS